MAEKLTVLIPCKNETHNIRACIESARGVADEILVADSLSTDDTPEIVRQAGGCRIIQREFVDHANFKNWAIPQASHPWVLVLDADERVTEELAAEIRAILAGGNPALDAYRLRRDNFFLDYPIRHCGWSSATVVRLLRRDVCRYSIARVHERLEVEPERVGTLRANSSTTPARRWTSGRQSRTATRPSWPKTNTRPAIGPAGWGFSESRWCDSFTSISSEAVFATACPA